MVAEQADTAYKRTNSPAIDRHDRTKVLHNALINCLMGYMQKELGLSSASIKAGLLASKHLKR